MKTIANIFEAAGYETAFTQNNGKAMYRMDLLSIVTKEGNISHFWPANLQNPLHLQFGVEKSLAGRFKTLFTQWTFAMGMQNQVFKPLVIWIKPLPGNKLNSLVFNNQWVVFTNDGLDAHTAYIYANNPEPAFTKLALDATGLKHIQTEMDVLDTMTLAQVKHFDHPDVVKSGSTYVTLSAMPFSAKKTVPFGKAHARCIQEIARFFRANIPLSDLPVWHETKTHLTELAQSTDARIPKSMVHKLTQLFERYAGKTKIETNLSHGDFAPWNLTLKKDKLFVSHWEQAKSMMPLGFDFFYYVMHQGIRLQNKNIEQLLPELFHNAHGKQLFDTQKEGQPSMQTYYHLFLALHVPALLVAMSAQETWTQETARLMHTLNAAVRHAMAPVVPQADQPVMVDPYFVEPSRLMHA